MSHTRNEEDKKPHAEPSIIQALSKGTALGSLEVMINHPLVYLKTRAQSTTPMPVNLRAVYRGFWMNAASIAPTTAVQIGMNHLLLQTFAPKKEQQTTTVRMLCALQAGAASALVSSWTERIIIRQQVGKQSAQAAMKEIWNAPHKWRSLYTGLGTTMLRDGKFTAGAAVIQPYIAKKARPCLEKTSFSKEEKVVAANIIGGLGAGIITTLLTQPHDVAKTNQQKCPPGQEIGFIEAYPRTCKTGYKGTLWRSTRMASAMTIINLAPILYDHYKKRA